MEKKGIVIFLEGSEQCGKTTLARKLQEVYKAEYLHGSRPLSGDFFDYHYSKLMYSADSAAEGHVVVIDRCFLSHKVYGELFDGGTAYNIDQLYGMFLVSCQERDVSNVIIYCKPETKFNPDLREEMYDDSDGKISKKFDEVMKEFDNRDYTDIIVYNWVEDPTAEKLLKEIDKRLTKGKKEEHE